MFWADWCPHCQKLKPIFETTAQKSPQIRFEVNVDRKPEIALRYGVQSIPMVKFFCKGSEIGRITGYRQKEDLEREIKRISENAEWCLAHTTLR
jgi:thioredoxin-like negative regulator of GroEL